MHGETLLEVATMPDAVHGQLDRHVRHPAIGAWVSSNAVQLF